MIRFLLRCLVVTVLGSALWAVPSSAQPPEQKQAPTDSSRQILDRIVKSKLPVLVDFWAPWCRPCRMLTPTLQEIEKQYHGKIAVIKVNIDIHRGIAGYFGVSAIPAIFLVKNRTVVNRIPGLQPKEAYVKAVDDMLVTTVPDPPADTSAEKKSGEKKAE